MMKWDDPAEALLKKVPFFVRKKVRRTVEAYAADLGADQVSPEMVRAARDKAMPTGPPGAADRFAILRQIENRPVDQKPIALYEINACNAGQLDCPNAVGAGKALQDALIERMEEAKLTEFIVASARGPILPHHRFKVGISSCPNSCSQVQIKDVGITAQLKPSAQSEGCTTCGVCVHVCREEGITLQEEEEGVVIDDNACIYCGQCISACEAEVLQTEIAGYGLQIGGRLGRHPRLAEPVADLLSTEQLLTTFDRILLFYKEQAKPGERFSHLIERVGLAPAVQFLQLPPRP